MIISISGGRESEHGLAAIQAYYPSPIYSLLCKTLWNNDVYTSMNINK